MKLSTPLSILAFGDILASPDRFASRSNRDLKNSLDQKFRRLAEAPPRRVRRKRIAAVSIILAVVTIVIGTFAVITRAGSEDNFVVSVIAALIFLPSLIAGMRLQRDQTAIFVCNVVMFVSLLLSAGSPPVFLLTLIGVAVAWVLTILWSLDRFLFLYGLVWRWQG